MTDSRTILVYDDDPAMADMIAKIARRNELEAVPVTTNDEFWSAYKNLNGNSAIVLDLVLSDGDGVAVLRQLADADCTAPLLLISGYNNNILSSVGRLGEQYGLEIRGMLGKPFGVEDLTRQLESLCQ